jgi:hypothetical protein
MASATLLANNTTNVDIGDSVTHHGVIIKYACTRGTDYQAGQVMVLNEDGTTTDYSWDYFGDDVGLTVSSDINAGDIRLVCAVDNSSANNIAFHYNVTRIDL